MDQVISIAREAVIVLGFIALVFGVGFGLLRLRRAMGGGLDDHLRLSTSPTLARVGKVVLAITAALWILIFVLMRDEYGSNLGEALDGLMETVAPAEPAPAPESTPSENNGSVNPPAR